MHLKLFPALALLISFGAHAELDKIAFEKAKKGDAASEYQIGLAYETGETIPKNEQAAAEWYTKSAIQGNADAQFRLGLLYFQGRGVPQRYPDAIDLLRKAAAQDHIASLTMLALIYIRNQKSEEAFTVTKRLSELGQAGHTFMLGMYYEEGKVVPKDINKALELYYKSAELGDASAKSWLGHIYEQGKLVKADLSKAAEYYKQAADQGDGDAEANIGRFYRTGKAVPKDPEKSIQYIKQSVLKKNNQGLIQLSLAYSTGSGVKKSSILAYAISDFCAEKCVAAPIRNILIESKQINENEVEIAKQLSGEMRKRDDVLSVADEYEKTF